MADERVSSVIAPSAFEELARLKKEILDAQKTLLDLIKTAASADFKFNNPSSISDLNDAIKELRDVVDSLKKAYQDQSKAANDLSSANERLARSTKQKNDASKEDLAFQRELDKAAKENMSNLLRLDQARQKEEKQIATLSNDYGLLSKAYNETALKAKNYALTLGDTHPLTVQAVADAKAMSDRLKQLDAMVGQHQRNVGNYASAFNNLSTSIGYVVSELPNLSQGFGLFFRAVGNNATQVYRDIDNIRKLNKQLAAEGKETTSIWSQVGKSIFSWQTGFTIAVTLLVTYGDKIIDWFTGVAKATKDAEESIKSFNYRLDELQKTNDKIETTLTNSDRLQIAKAKSEGKSEEEITAIVKKQINDRIAAKESYIGQLQKEYNTQHAIMNQMAKDDKVRQKVFDDQVKATSELDKKIADEKNKLTYLKTDLDVKQYDLEAYLYGERKKLQEKDAREYEQYLKRKQKALEDLAQKLKEVSLKIRTITEEDIKSTLEEISGNDAGFSSGIISGAISKSNSEANKKQLVEIERSFTQELIGIENKRARGRYKTKEDYEKSVDDLTQKYADKRIELEKKGILDQLQYLQLGSNEYLDAVAKLNELELEYNRQKNESKEAQDKKSADRRKAIEKTAKDAIVQMWGVALDAYTNSQQTKINNNLAALDRELERIDRAGQHEIELINASKLSSEEKQKAIQQSQAKTESQRQAIEARQRQDRQRLAEAEKQNAVAQIILNTALAVIKAYTEGDPYTKVFRAALAAGVGAAQLAVAMSAPLPQYAEGTLDHKGGRALIGEAGKELVKEPSGKMYTVDKPTVVNLPKHTQVFNQDQLYAMLTPSMLRYVNNQKVISDNKELASRLETAMMHNTDRQIKAMRKNRAVLSVMMSGGTDSYYQTKVKGK